VRSYALTILLCVAVAVGAVLMLSALEVPFWVVPLVLFGWAAAASLLKRRSAATVPPVQDRSTSASWERTHPLGAGLIVGGLVGLICSGFLLIKAPDSVSHLYLSSLGFGFGFGLFIGLVTFATLRLPRRLR
jgi:hypothetical protein